MFWNKLLLMFSGEQILLCWHLQHSCWTLRLFPQLVKKCTKQQADSNSSSNFNVKREWTIHAHAHVPRTVCQKTTLKVFSQSRVKCERRQCWSRDKVWGMAVRENLRWGEKAREMPTQASVSECVIVQRDPFLRVCQGRSEWMPIIPPNNVSQQYFNDVPFVEKPLSSQELIGF